MTESGLRAHPFRRAPEGPVIFVVMDGIGLSRSALAGVPDPGDAVALARTPTLDWLRGLPSAAVLRAHGTAVGMPSDRDMGNSEVGHNAIGAGRVFEQGAALVEQSLASGALYEGETWRWLIEPLVGSVGSGLGSGPALHFIGLLSDGNIHAHIDHLLALLHQAAREGVAKVRVHILTDGRDVPGRSALAYIDRLEATLAEIGAEPGRDYCIASGGGRMAVTMDRYEADWSMVARGWNLHVHGEGRKFGSARQAVETLYAESDEQLGTGSGSGSGAGAGAGPGQEQGVDDQYLPSFVIADQAGLGDPVGPICDGDSVLLFNFRGDRALEITRAFEAPADAPFTPFERGRVPARIRYAGMMQYDGDLALPTRFLVDPPVIRGSMGERLAAAGRTQWAIAETHKYGHVTYFWNGNRSEPFAPELERYMEVHSELAPVDERPWMMAAEVTDRLLAELDQARPGPDFVRLNYANGDMVGHTGDLRSTILAVEVVDLCLARLVAETRRRRGVLIVTADHGNADQMFDGEGEARRPRTSHSLNPVPLAIYDPRERAGGPALRTDPDAPLRSDPDAPMSPGLANLAATTLELLGLCAPADYAPSLLARSD